MEKFLRFILRADKYIVTDGCYIYKIIPCKGSCSSCLYPDAPICVCTKNDTNRFHIQETAFSFFAHAVIRAIYGRKEYV